MPAPQTIPPLSEAEKQAHTDGVILEVLLDDDGQRPWSEDEIARVVEDSIAAADGLRRLARDGLVHRLDRFVFATRSALRANEIAQ